MIKEYIHKGYTFRQTAYTTKVQQDRKSRSGGIRVHTSTKNLYEIDGLKPAAKRPWLTSVQDCKDYINAFVEGNAANPSNMGKVIYSARIRRGMSQEELGLALGYEPNYGQAFVSRWERGTRPVPMDKIKPLARILGISPLDLLP